MLICLDHQPLLSQCWLFQVPKTAYGGSSRYLGCAVAYSCWIDPLACPLYGFRDMRVLSKVWISALLVRQPLTRDIHKPTSLCCEASFGSRCLDLGIRRYQWDSWQSRPCPSA